MSEKIERFVGIDTSNYTTSVGVVGSDGSVQNLKKLLPVREGDIGLRQSDALFCHVKQFADVYGMANIDECVCVGVSTRPRAVDGSYMPCFLAGENFAKIISLTLGVPMFSFSHQQGHIAAGLLSAERTDMINEHFLAFHLSGGTLELLDVNGISDIRIVAKTLDLTAGQLIDRTGVALGLRFPAGAELEKLSEGCSLPESVRICLKQNDCCLSGFENKVNTLIAAGVSAGEIGIYVFETVAQTVKEMVVSYRKETGNIPCMFVGGVMSNAYIKKKLELLGNVFFASPFLSSDNAVGIALLAKMQYNGQVIL